MQMSCDQDTHRQPALDSIDTAYDHFKSLQTNCSEHYETLRKYARQCCSVTELGSGDMIATWPLLRGLSESESSRTATSQSKWMTCVDIKPSSPTFETLAGIARASAGIKLSFIQGDSLKLKIRETDMMLIDTLHCYAQLKKELVKHAPNVKRYIAILNTDVYGETSELVREFYHYDIDSVCERLKCSHSDACAGVKRAIQEFVSPDPDAASSSAPWMISETRDNNNGLVILERRRQQ